MVALDVYQLIVDDGLPVRDEVILYILLRIDELGAVQLADGDTVLHFQLVRSVALLVDVQHISLAECEVRGFANVGVARLRTEVLVLLTIRNRRRSGHLGCERVGILMGVVVIVLMSVDAGDGMVDNELPLGFFHEYDRTDATFLYFNCRARTDIHSSAPVVVDEVCRGFGVRVKRGLLQRCR